MVGVALVASDAQDVLTRATTSSGSSPDGTSTTSLSSRSGLARLFAASGGQSPRRGPPLQSVEATLRPFFHVLHVAGNASLNWFQFNGSRVFVSTPQFLRLRQRGHRHCRGQVVRVLNHHSGQGICPVVRVLCLWVDDCQERQAVCELVGERRQRDAGVALETAHDRSRPPSSASSLKGLEEVQERGLTQRLLHPDALYEFPLLASRP